MSPEDLSSMFQILAFLVFLPTFVLSLIPLCLPQLSGEINVHAVVLGTSLTFLFHQMANMASC